MPSRTAAPSYKPCTLSDLRRGTVSRTVRVYADGVYDLLHYGHLEQLKQIKDAIPGAYVIVGVCSDADTLLYKGCLPVMSESERARSLALSKFVDEVIEHPPFYPTIDFLDSIQADLMAHDSLPYPSPDVKDCYAEFKIADRFLETQRAEHISTTDLLARILKQASIFEERNRRRDGGLKAAAI